MKTFKWKKQIDLKNSSICCSHKRQLKHKGCSLFLIPYSFGKERKEKQEEGNRGGFVASRSFSPLEIGGNSIFSFSSSLWPLVFPLGNQRENSTKVSMDAHSFPLGGNHCAVLRKQGIKEGRKAIHIKGIETNRKKKKSELFSVKSEQNPFVLEWKRKETEKLKTNGRGGGEGRNTINQMVPIKEEYFLETFKRSNQDTCLIHKPSVLEGNWVQSGDLLTDCASSVGGELSLGQNLLIAYMPWEGYNFEDAILISERLVMDDLYTSVHIERYELETQQTKIGAEEITRNIPDVSEKELAHLDAFGIIKLGSWVEEGDILVGKITPVNKKKISAYQKLLYTILEKQVRPIKDSSLRAPKGIKAKVIDIKYFLKSSPFQRKSLSFGLWPLVDQRKDSTNLWPTKGKAGKTGPEAKGKGQKTKGYAFRSLNKEKKRGSLVKKPLCTEVKKSSPSFLPVVSSKNGWLKLDRKLKKSFHMHFKLLRSSLNSYSPFPTSCAPAVKGFDLLFRSFRSGRLPYFFPFPFAFGIPLGKNFLPLIQKEKANEKESNKRAAKSETERKKKNGLLQLKRKSNRALLGNITSTEKLLENGKGRKGNQTVFFKENPLLIDKQTKKTEFKKATLLKNMETIHIYLAEKRKVQVGDKMAGRHGNKGIVSKILPIQDMPYLPDGTPIDMVLNPLGVPSRMNVGQIYECLLGLAGRFLGENYKVSSFDEIYGPEASRSFVFNKLYEARSKTGLKWLFDPNSPGKIRLYDGRNGECFDQKVTVGQAYMLRLVHMVDDKIHVRSTGPYSLVTQQPLRGRSKQGGQRLGEMEVWALEGYGAAFTLLEMLTIKSDDMTGRMTLWSNLILNKDISIGTPESFKVLICELQALCLDIGLFRYSESNNKKSNLREINNLINLP